MYSLGVLGIGNSDPSVHRPYYGLFSPKNYYGLGNFLPQRPVGKMDLLGNWDGIQQGSHDPLGAMMPRRDQPVSQHVGGELLGVIGDGVAAPL